LEELREGCNCHWKTGFGLHDEEMMNTEVWFFSTAAPLGPPPPSNPFFPLDAVDLGRRKFSDGINPSTRGLRTRGVTICRSLFLYIGSTAPNLTSQWSKWEMKSEMSTLGSTAPQISLLDLASDPR
jgi:hypothetical protein